MLPVSGEDGSLTVNNDIVVDTAAPYVVAVLSLREGVYTVGEAVDLQVRTMKRMHVMYVECGLPQPDLFCRGRRATLPESPK